MRTQLITIALIALFSNVTFAQPPGPKGPRRPGPPAKGGTTELKVNQADPPARFDVAQAGIERGKVTPFEYESKAGGGKFKATIYTPPGYSSTKKYPVLYLLHGASGDENNWVHAIHADAILDNLYADKKLAPMLVVMPSALSVPARENAGNDRDAKSRAGMAFGDVLLKDLIPFVESKYPVAAGREHRALAGLSMGAGIALNKGLTNSDQFAWVGGFSGGGSRIAETRFDVTSKDRQPRLLWLSVGDRDSLTGSGMASADAFLTEKKIPHVFRVNAGGHEPKVWMNDLYYFAPLLFRP